MLLHTLRRGCGEMSEDEEEVCLGERHGLMAEQEKAVIEIYGLIAGLIQDDGTVSKEELVKAHGGDYKVWQNCSE
jgi:hypothetical protein